MPWINNKFWYTRDKIVTSEQCFYNKPQVHTSATDVLVVHPTTHEIGTLPINSLVSSSHGNNMWYESWHMTTENIDASNNYANIGKRVYYHGFRAHKTGEYTNMKVRIQNTKGVVVANNSLDMSVAIYDSINLPSSFIDAQPYPNVLQGEGSKNFSLVSPSPTYGTHSFLDISFNNSIPVTRGNIYFVALFYNDGIDGLFGLGSNNANFGNHSLSYSTSSQTINSFVSPVPTSTYLEPNGLAAYWFTLYGPETATGSTSGSSGPINSTISFFSDFNVGGISNMQSFTLDLSNNTTGFPILPHGSGAMASINGIVMQLPVSALNNSRLWTYGAYMPRDGEIYCAAINYNYQGSITISKRIIAINYSNGDVGTISSFTNQGSNGSVHATFSPTISFSQGDHIGIAIQSAATSLTTDKIVVEGTLFLKLT